MMDGFLLKATFVVALVTLTAVIVAGFIGRRMLARHDELHEKMNSLYSRAALDKRAAREESGPQTEGEPL